MRRFEQCSPVIPVGSSFYQPPPMNPLTPQTAKSRALEQNHLSVFQNPPLMTRTAQVNMLNNSPYVLAGKTLNQVKYDTFEVAFMERAGNQLWDAYQEGDISEDEFYFQVAKERQRLRIERGESGTESEYLLTSEEEPLTQTETESEEELPAVMLDPRTIEEEEALPLPKPRGGARSGAGRMTREEKAMQSAMRMEGIKGTTKTDVQVEMALEDILSGV